MLTCVRHNIQSWQFTWHPIIHFSTRSFKGMIEKEISCRIIIHLGNLMYLPAHCVQTYSKPLAWTKLRVQRPLGGHLMDKSNNVWRSKLSKTKQRGFWFVIGFGNTNLLNSNSAFRLIPNATMSYARIWITIEKKTKNRL